MGKILKETFAIINKNLWLLFLFMTVSYFGLVYFSMLKAAADTLPKILFGLVTLFLIIIVGIAGFFHTLRTTIDVETSVSDKENVEIIKAFPKGVADYFGTASGIVFIYMIISALMLWVTYLLGMKFVGMFSFSMKDFSDSLMSMDKLTNFMQSISVEDFFKLTKWHLIYVGTSSVVTFLLLYWLPETFYSIKNPFLSLFGAIKKSILNPLKTLGLFFTIVLINFAVSILMSIMLPIPILSLFIYFVYFYGLLFIMALTFNYYRTFFICKSVVVENKDEFVKEDCECEDASQEE